MLRFEDAKEKGECQLILDTPYFTIKTDSYVAFTKVGDKKNIEVNNLDLDEIKEFQSMLFEIIKENEKKFFEED